MTEIETFALVYGTTHPLAEVIVVERPLFFAINVFEYFHQVEVFELYAATLITEVTHDILG